MTTDLTRPRPPFPYDLLPPLPTFTLESGDIVEGERIADRFTALGENLSPELHWSGFPQETRSFVVSCFDPDAPDAIRVVALDGAGPRRHDHFSAPRAGESDLRLDGAAFHAANDSGSHAWFGPTRPRRRRPPLRLRSARAGRGHSGPGR